MDLTNHKTKLSRRVYFLISTIYAYYFISLLCLKYINDFDKFIEQILSDYYLLLIILFPVLMLLIFILPERNNLIIYATITVWVLLIIGLMTLAAHFSLPYFNLITFLFLCFCHHFIVTLFVMYTKRFNFKVFWFNLVLTIFGISLILL